MQVRNFINTVPGFNDKSIKIYYEHIFSQPFKIINGEYIYEYPKHWVDYNTGEKAIEIRQIKTIPAGRTIELYNFGIIRDNHQYDLQIYIDLDTGDDMTAFNKKIKSVLIEQLKGAGYPQPNEVDMFYSFETNSIEFRVNSNSKAGFIFDVKDSAVGDEIENVYTNKNFQEITGINNDECFYRFARFGAEQITLNDLLEYLPKSISIKNDDYLLTSISFNGVWSREAAIIKSSISEFAEDSILCLSNCLYSPPKHYSITNYVNKFNIK
ncbi:hypothetical protein TVAG_360600 [Trichomonas vaginalis G3]|uniref:Uncharacterized protein n=1 Tax=Trichomonas vaginalis (strain ATCC PRA-98 / G3) TaxID=412133 RepID=A2FLK0_TRIV3|nr:hypothetical protein TVAGG3_0101090 [Trichomonas vaginalis G3]EAX94214.1 hypothetical protein TVAG_360600 [Trichomonas vaginalis G3]KAI5544388.1 hypothetical protein TVAGG3_0101090 [Trichomonas vaginalis G3]|eukprot:XP_001307144.1 hypothetical protein [Trichomonas vaginalis G3]